MNAIAIPNPTFVGGPAPDFTMGLTFLVVGGIVVSVLAVVAFVVLVIYQDRPLIAPVAVQAMTCVGGAFMAGIVASWVGVMLLV